MFLVTDEAGANPEKEHDVILATLVEHYSSFEERAIRLNL